MAVSKTPEQLAAHPPGTRARRETGSGKMDLPFLLVVLALVIFGLVMLFSATYAYCYYKNNQDSFYLIRKQAIWAAVGLVAMLLCSVLPYHFYRKIAWIAYGGALGLLALTLGMPAINGAHRWVFIAGQQFQPSELMKFAVVVVFSMWIYQYFDKMKTFKYGVLPFACMIIPVVVIMMLQPHTSGTILILALAALLMLVGGTRIYWFIGAGVLGGAGIVGYILTSEKMAYVLDRVRLWLDPFIDAQDKGFQTIQSLYAIGSGGLFGVGIGNSKQKHLFIPEPQNDFIFAIVCEELGLLGAILVIALFAILVWRGIHISIKAKDRFGSLVAFGLTMQVGLQALLNIAVVTNTVPNTGISLPFFSYGGTSLVVLMAEMGVILNISRSANLRRT